MNFSSPVLMYNVQLEPEIWIYYADVLGTTQSDFEEFKLSLTTLNFALGVKNILLRSWKYSKILYNHSTQIINSVQWVFTAAFVIISGKQSCHVPAHMLIASVSWTLFLKEVAFAFTKCLLQTEPWFWLWSQKLSHYK